MVTEILILLGLQTTYMHLGSMVIQKLEEFYYILLPFDMISPKHHRDFVGEAKILSFIFII